MLESVLYLSTALWFYVVFLFDSLGFLSFFMVLSTHQNIGPRLAFEQLSIPICILLIGNDLCPRYNEAS